VRDTPRAVAPSGGSFAASHHGPSGIIDGVSSVGLEHLAQTAYEAHRSACPESLPPWEETSTPEQDAWKAAVSAVAGKTGVTLTDAASIPVQSIKLQAGELSSTFHGDFIAGRHAAMSINDEYASNQHVRFQIAHGQWYVKDLGSTNGTWLNGRRIHAPQRLKKGDKIRIGHTVVTVVSA
jgi:pSer/pThr/pTyr-binding forkhead associated (FHA) protein